MNNDLPLTTAQTCTALGIHRNTLREWVRAGKITPTWQLPGQKGAYLFTRDEVERVKTERNRA